MLMTSKHPFVEAEYKPSPSCPTGACRSKEVASARVAAAAVVAPAAAVERVAGADKPLAERTKCAAVVAERKMALENLMVVV